MQLLMNMTEFKDVTNDQKSIECHTCLNVVSAVVVLAMFDEEETLTERQERTVTHQSPQNE